MKLVIASDIHGSAYWCEKLLAFFKNSGAEQLVLVGDLLYHGPRNPLPDGYAPMEVVEMLSALKEKIICVRGNCDSEVDQMVLPFPIMADYALLNADGQKLFATHGHLFSNENPPLLEKGDVLLNGHFHTPMDLELAGGIRYANCGSVALPKENTPHSYIVCEKGVLTWKEL